MNFLNDYAINRLIKFKANYQQFRNFTTFKTGFKIGNQDTLLIDISYDPIELKQAVDYVNNTNFSNVIYLTSNILEANGTDVIFFPGWLFHDSMHYSRMPKHDIQRKRSYKLSCLNRFPSHHKLYLYLKLLNKPYVDEMLLSFFGLRNPYDFKEISINDSMYMDLSDDIKQEAISKNLYKESIPSDDKWDNDHTLTHPAFFDTYANIITETRTNYSIFTEKTAKPLACGQLFFHANGSHAIYSLRKMQFETFDDILDNSYDLITNWQDRIDMLISAIDLAYDNLEEFYFQKRREIEYNQNYFLSDSFRNKLLTPLAEFIEK